VAGYAVFSGDEYYHLVRRHKYRTVCGLRLIGRGRGEKTYLPPARVLQEQAPRLPIRRVPGLHGGGPAPGSDRVFYLNTQYMV
jgi:hypothetical protein